MERGMRPTVQKRPPSEACRGRRGGWSWQCVLGPDVAGEGSGVCLVRAPRPVGGARGAAGGTGQRQEGGAVGLGRRQDGRGRCPGVALTAFPGE